MISNGALSDSFRASNTFNSLSFNGRRLSRSSLIGMTTEIHGCDERVMRIGAPGGPSRAFYPRPSGDSNRSQSPEHNAAVDMRCEGWIVRDEHDRPGFIFVGDVRDENTFMAEIPSRI